MKKNRINQTGQSLLQNMDIAAAWNFRTAGVIGWMTALLIISTLFLFTARPAWGSVGGFFICASPYEMGGGYLLFGLCMAALGYGMRLVLRTNIAKPHKK